ncbi:MAG: right-handed parallel beta-helix repeat-containing protein, partial [Bacteroidales bacterium]|nr:right-handed parallel beta-helix repeat-containing protein [Bacteroidales bacterium]
MKHIFTLLAILVIISNLTQAQNPFGNGSDGNLTVNQGETLLINTEQTTVSGANFTGSNAILVDSTGGIQIGDEVLIITMTDPKTDMALNAVGNWETHIVAGTSSNSLILNSGLQHSYFTANGEKHQVVKVPNYAVVDIAGTLSCPAWNGSTGGILFFRSDEDVTVQATGIISSSSKGYRGGNQYGSSHGGGQGGESIIGPGGDGGHYAADPHGKVGSGGGGAAYNGYSGGNALAGGGGGATGGSVGLGSPNTGGAGGGGGGHAGSAGGAGYGTFGFGGFSYSGSNNGQNGGENFSGNGGSNGTGGGGGGGGTYGSAELTKLFPGSGGGRGGRHDGQTSGIGGNGGGLLYISSAAINCEGLIQTNGGNGGNGATYSGGGGGASGGSLYLNAISIDISNAVSASGGTGGNGYYGNKAGDGGDGRIRLDYLNLANTGNISPSPYQGQFSNITHYAMPNTSNTAGPYQITAYILDNEGDPITQARLFYRINGGSFSQLIMTAGVNPAEYSANIPGQAINSTIEYYFTASDGTDNYTAPSGAPAEQFSFQVTAFPPYGLLAEDNFDGSVNLNWFEPIDLTNFTHYSIYRSEQDGFTPGAFNKIADNLNDTTYVDNTVVDFHTYYYIVSAHFNFGGTLLESFDNQTDALLVNNTGETTVLGYAFLEDQNNHANIKVKFVPLSPSAVADSIYTNALGYFETHDIFPGVYSIRLIKNGYQTPYTMENMSIVQDTDLGESDLYDMGTEVSGNVSGTWSDFISVSGDITVPNGDSLIIEAGTIVRFLGYYNMFVYGYLESNGTESNPVTITSGPVNQIQQPNQWAGIDFYTDADDNSGLQYTIIEYAYDGLYFEWSSGSVENCTFQYNSRYGMYLNRSDGSVISNSSFNNNNNSGIYMDYSTSNMNACQFLSNTSWGIQMYNYSTLFMDACLLDNSSYGIRCQEVSDLRLTNTTISNMANDGIYFSDVYNRGEITNNTFYSNVNGIYLYHRSSPKISGNNFTTNGDGIEIYYDCDSEISHNVFTANSNGMFFNGSSHYCQNRIFNNMFAYNSNDGIHKNGYSTSYNNDPYIFNNTIFGNGGDGIQVNSFGTEIIRNNIISENSGYGINSAFYTDTCENNNIYGNALGEISNLANMPSETWNFVSTNPNNNASCDIYRNINEDPVFNLSDTLDLTLQISSKCIDGGSENITDPDGTISDIGALLFDQGNPHTISATGYGNQQVSLAWDAVTNDSLVDYKVYYKQHGAVGAYTLFGSTSNTTVDVTGLTNNQLYDFSVTGNYANYESPYAPPVSERPGVATMDYDPGSFSLIIPAEDDSIIDNFSVTNTGSRDLNFNFPKSATNSAYTYFDGSGDYLTYGHHDYMDGMTALTMECWLYRQNNGHFDFMGKNYR